MKKQILASFLSLVLVLSLVPASALAVEEQTGPETPVCAELTGCTEDTHDPACPLYVTPGGDDNAYYEFEDVTTLGTSSALTTQAADGMSGTCGATESDSVTWALTKNEDGEDTYTLTISGTGAMADFTTGPDFQPWKDQRAKITALVVEDGITYLGNRAFQNCSNLKTVTLPTSLTILGTHVFKACSALESLDLSNIVSFGKEAFVNCSGLTQLTMPTALTISEIPQAAFSGLSKVENDIVIPAGVTSIGPSAFVNWGSLNDNTVAIQWNKSVKTVGNSAFQGAKIDEALQIPASVETLGTKAFWKTGITSLSFGDDSELTTIGELAFSECNSLAGNVTIPAKVTKIGKQAFMKTGITGLSFADHSALTEIGEQAFYQTASLNGQITLPDSVKTIGSLAFSESGITGLTISENSKLSSIGESAFAKCKSLEGTIYIPGGVSQVGNLAFSNISLTKLILAEGVKTIGNSAFACDTREDSLHTVIFPSTLTSIGEHAFYNSASIHSMYFPSSPPTVGSSAFFAVPNTCIVYCQGAAPTGEELKGKIFAITNGGTFAEDTQFTDGQLATPTKEGCIFGGWYTKDGTSGDWGNEVTTPEADKTYYAKWIELTADAITMEYGSTQAFPTIDGVALKDWTSDNEKVVQIVNGELKAVGVGKANITANAVPDAARSGETLTVSVTVTAKKIKVSMTDKTETYNEQPHTIEAEAAEGGTLPTDLELVYSYKESNASDDEYIHVAPSHPGTYTVKVESGNPNYTLDGTTTATLTISEPQQEQDVSDHVTVTAPSLVYDGKAKVYTAAYEGITDWTIAYYDTEGTKLDSAPVNAGDYWVTINGDGAGVYASITESFTITPATLTIKANNQSIRVGDQLPEYTYTVSGWQGNDTDDLLSGVTATCPTADANKAGDYTITVSGPAAIDNYTISYVDGTLTVSRRSSGGGGGGSSSSSTTTETERNPDGSTTTTVTDKKTGTVTETTKFKDGSTLVVETKKDGTVTTTETAKNGVKVKTVDEPGEDVTAKVTIPRSVGEAVVTIPADVDYGMVAVDAKTGEVVKLSVPTKDGMTVKLDGSAELVLVDRSRDFTDTKGHWAEDAIDFATAHELFAGTSDTTFTPNSPMTRAMLMTVLARFDGQDTTGGAVWYEKAMAWAQENGISDGSNPNGSITREQLATMLWRYAGSPIGDGSLSSFGDSASVNGYAVEALRWAVGEGLISGTDTGLLAPQGNATRAQVATILMRFVESLTK